MSDDATTPPSKHEPNDGPRRRTLREARRKWRIALAERQRRAEALDKAVRQSTGIDVPSYSVTSIAEISLFPGISNDLNNGHLASSAQSVLRQPNTKPPSSSSQD